MNFLDLRWDWVPGIRVGELRFGAPFDPEKYAGEIELLEPAHEDDEMNTYRVEYGVYVVVAEKLIVFVGCWVSLLFRGIEIIGLSEQELPRVLGHVPREVSRSPSVTRLDVPELGLILWIEEGHVEAADVGPVRDE